MIFDNAHTPTHRKTRRGGNRDLILGIASAAPSGFFTASAMMRTYPGIGMLILAGAILTGVIVWYMRRKHRARADEPLLFREEVHADLDGAPPPPAAM